MKEKLRNKKIQQTIFFVSNVLLKSKIHKSCLIHNIIVFLIFRKGGKFISNLFLLHFKKKVYLIICKAYSSTYFSTSYDNIHFLINSLDCNLAHSLEFKFH